MCEFGFVTRTEFFTSKVIQALEEYSSDSDLKTNLKRAIAAASEEGNFEVGVALQNFQKAVNGLEDTARRFLPGCYW